MTETPARIESSSDVEPLRPAVVAIAVSASLSSGAALVASIVFDKPLWLTSSFVLVPGLIAIVALSVIARRDEQDLFLSRLWRGAAAGLVGTLAYDVSRWVIEALEITSTNSFVAMPAFGAGLTGADPAASVSYAAGWAFHFVNGIGFGVAYLFLAAGRRWWWGVLFALVLEGFMVGLYPGWLDMSVGSEFLSVSILGHVAYGAVIGIAGQRSR